MRHTFLNNIIPLLAVVMVPLILSGCNDEVFVKPLDIDRTAASLDWTGGSAVFETNEPIEYVDIVAYRWHERRGYPITDAGMQHYLSPSEKNAVLKSPLCNIAASIDHPHSLRLSSAPNLFADTLFFDFTVYTRFEQTRCSARIMPSPGFPPGEIVYSLSTWSERPETVERKVWSFMNPGDTEVRFVPFEGGSAVARATATFVPDDEELSANIFGRDARFEVPYVSFSKYWKPYVTTDVILYGTDKVELTHDALVAANDLVVTVPARSKLWMTADIVCSHAGFGYKLPALSTTELVPDIDVTGVLWLSLPQSLTYEVEITEL